MSYEVRWLVPDRVALQRFYGKVRGIDIQLSGPALLAFVQTGLPMVHTIIDASAVESYPNLIELKKGASMKRDAIEGWRIVVGTEGMMKFAASFVLPLSGQRFRLHDTYYDALAFLTEQDESLDLTQIER
jgi:hypothetical protein